MSDSDMGGSPQDYEPPSYTSCDDVSERCPVSVTVYGDYFTTGACAFFVAAHGALLLAQMWFGWRSRAWSFTVYLGLGTIFEIMGYAARIALSYNPWIFDAFVIQLLMLILGPTLVAASISVTFKHIVLYYGPEWSFLKPRWYPWVFVGTDFFSIVIQAAGGGVSSVATDGEEDNQDLLDVGSGMLVAGVVFQLVNMVFCGGLMLFYFWRRWRALKNVPTRAAAAAGATTNAAGGSGGDSSDASLPPGDREKKVGQTTDPKVKLFLYAISAAYMFIIIRCIYRYVSPFLPFLSLVFDVRLSKTPRSIPEMQMGWASDLMQNETTFLILDGAMILLAVLTLTVFHPCFFFPFLGRKDVSAPVNEFEATNNVDGGDVETRSASNVPR